MDSRNQHILDSVNLANLGCNSQDILDRIILVSDNLDILNSVSLTKLDIGNLDILDSV